MLPYVICISRQFFKLPGKSEVEYNFLDVFHKYSVFSISASVFQISYVLKKISLK